MTDQEAEVREFRPARRQSYIGPGEPGNKGNFYVLPTTEQILYDLKACSGRLDLWLAKHIKNEKMHGVVVTQLLELLEQDDKYIQQFHDIRRRGEEATLLLAEDALYSQSLDQTQSNNFRAMDTLLQRRNPNRWGKVGDKKTKSTGKDNFDAIFDKAEVPDAD